MNVEQAIDILNERCAKANRDFLEAVKHRSHDAMTAERIRAETLLECISVVRKIHAEETA